MGALRHIIRFKALRVALVAVLLLGTLPCCSLTDSRDLCCRYRAAMRYTYLPYGTEAFTEYINSLRHLLYGADGRFIAEVPPGEDLQYQPLSLPQGRYTMLTIANIGEGAVMNHSDGSAIHHLTLVHDGRMRDTILSNADELYWGLRRFAIDADGYIADLGARAEGEAQGEWPVTEMNNIHCHLSVQVEWFNMPPHIGDYEMELTGVPTRYRLSPAEAAEADGFIVPTADSLGTHRIQVPMEAWELQGEFITLRYTDDNIPTLRLHYGKEQVGPDIDLARAFRTWGWRPSQIHVQRYAVHIRIYGDGRAELSPGINASVADWINGGTFS